MSDLGLTITIQYSCVLCGIRDASVRVPARASDEDVERWVNMAIRATSDDHKQRSPDCKTRTLQNLKIPMDGAEWIGGPAVQ